MKILQIIQKEQFRGAEIFSCQLSNHFLALGHQVRILSIFRGKTGLPFNGEIRSLERDEKNRIFDFRGWKALADFIKEYDPDIIQANAADTLKYAIFSKLFFRWKVPVIYRNASTASFYLKNPVSRFLNKQLLKKVDLIISVSKASKKDLNLLYPFTAKKTLVIPIGVEDKKVAVKQNNRNAVLLHVGSFTKEKNHLELLYIFKRVLEVEPRALLYLVGEGPELPHVKRKVAELGLEERVLFQGVHKDPYHLITNADVVVLPSQVEGLPAVLLEAMFCKTPVVAYNVGGISEVVDQDTGTLVPAGNKSAFAKAVVAVLHEPPVLQVENAFNRVKRDFMNEKLAYEFLKHYQDVLRREV